MNLFCYGVMILIGPLMLAMIWGTPGHLPVGRRWTHAPGRKNQKKAGK